MLLPQLLLQPTGGEQGSDVLLKCGCAGRQGAVVLYPCTATATALASFTPLAHVLPLCTPTNNTTPCSFHHNSLPPNLAHPGRWCSLETCSRPRRRRRRGRCSCWPWGRCTRRRFACSQAPRPFKRNVVTHSVCQLAPPIAPPPRTSSTHPVPPPSPPRRQGDATAVAPRMPPATQAERRRCYHEHFAPRNRHADAPECEGAATRRNISLKRNPKIPNIG